MGHCTAPDNLMMLYKECRGNKCVDDMLLHDANTKEAFWCSSSRLGINAEPLQTRDWPTPAV